MTDQLFDQPMTLMKRVRELMTEFKEQDYMCIYKDTGIPYFWVRKFARGEFKNPSVNRVQYLYEHLTKKPLLEAQDQ